MMQVSAASWPGDPEVPNEDWWGAAGSAVVVLDGVTIPEGIERTCGHGTPWYVQQLGSRILSGIAAGLPAEAAVGSAITAVAAWHPSCQPDSLGAPSAALAVVSFTPDGSADCYILGDVTVALETSAPNPTVFTDPRVTDLNTLIDTTAPDVAGQIAAQRRTRRNQPGGYWVAGGSATAASHAVTGRVAGVKRGAVLTDGAACVRDMAGVTWETVIGCDAPHLLGVVRAAEATDPDREKWPRFKVSDDATAVMVTP